MRSRGHSTLQGPRAMAIEGFVLMRYRRTGIDFQLVDPQRGCLQEGDPLVENRPIACGLNVASDRVRQPEHVVRTSRPHARTRVSVPPVLYIAFPELACGR